MDDTNIYFEAKNINDMDKIINKELKNVYLWLNLNPLSLNIAKTNFVVFHPFNKPLKTSLTIKINKAIEQKDYIKYLGVIIDSTLSWKQQVANVAKIGALWDPSAFIKLI